MARVLRALTGLILLVTIAACGAPQSSSKFRSYSGPPVTQVVINKGERKMYLFSGRKVLKQYNIGLGFAPDGPKMFEGDGKTPEGTYFIDRKNPNSRYYLSVGISYPSPSDEARAASYGMAPGRDIFIHGWGTDGKNASDRKIKDWTAGCIAINDREIEEVFAMLQPGVVVVINP